MIMCTGCAEAGCHASGTILRERRDYRCAAIDVDAVVRRLRTVVFPILAEHGAAPDGPWWRSQDATGFVAYDVEWPDADRMSQGWTAFRADPRWRAVAGDLTVQVETQTWHSG